MNATPNLDDTTLAAGTSEEVRHFLDIPMRVSIQLSSRNMKISEILRLQQGSVVDLPKSAGENVDILLNGRLIAFGEVLEMEGCAGIRLTDLHVQR